MSQGWCFFAIPSRRNLSLASLLFNSVAGRRSVLEKGRQGRQEAAGDRYGSLLQTGIVAKFEKCLPFFQRPPINYIFRHVLAEFRLHLSNFLREKRRSSSPPGWFQTMVAKLVTKGILSMWSILNRPINASCPLGFKYLTQAFIGRTETGVDVEILCG